MNGFLIYLLKVNLLLVFLYGFYLLFFRRDTFYGNHRWYLLSALLSALLFPALNPAAWFHSREIPMAADVLPVEELYRLLLLLQSAPEIAPPRTPSGTHPATLLTAGVLAGALFLLVKRLRQLFGIVCLALRASRQIFGQQTALVVNEAIQPFSFFRWIFLPLRAYRQETAEEIIAHERIHCRKYHSADILLSETVACLCWYNPVAWLLRGELRQNLEFYTDRQMLALGYERKSYQYHLLQISGNVPDYSIVNHFYFNHLKKRIIMMNKKNSPRVLSVKYLLALPVMLAAMWAVRASDSETAISHAVGTALFSSTHTEAPTAPASSAADGETAKSPIVYSSRDTVKSSLPAEAEWKRATLGDYSDKQLIIINGETASAAEINRLKPDDIESVGILKGETAVQMYGDMGKNGAIIITLNKGAVVDSITGNRKRQETQIAYYLSGDLLPLFLVDGEETGLSVIGRLPPSVIHSVNLLKSEAATKEYGEKGKNGVISITLKKNASADSIKNILKTQENHTLQETDANMIKDVTLLKGEAATGLYGEKGKREPVTVSIRDDRKGSKQTVYNAFGQVIEVLTADNWQLTIKADSLSINMTEQQLINFRDTDQPPLQEGIVQ
ncbi:MAG: M56 family metallopeptidase [Bacteroidales bacterium]|jgi:hypothetical protein|nr:M56 family metallopeptidase [Bacteroidales bacterium]